MPQYLSSRDEAVEWLLGRINYERSPAGSFTAGDLKLERMERLLDLLGNPHRGLPAVHIAGTKGKGSTAAMVSSVLTAAGFRTALFTSPHLDRLEERMVVDGQQPSPEVFLELTRTVAAATAKLDAGPPGLSPTCFELITAVAWLYFQQCHVDVAVLEVGLGGRLDSTNLCEPAVSLITSISLDHTAILGSTTPEIAREKAGIIRPNVPVISGVTDEAPRAVIEEVCRAAGAPLYELDRQIHTTPTVSNPWNSYPDLSVPLPGQHQVRNAALAVTAIDILRQQGWNIPPEAVTTGLQSVSWPARIEILSRQPAVIVDTAHNAASIEALTRTLNEEFQPRRRTILLGVTRDKDIRGMLRGLEGYADRLILTNYLGNPRALPVERLAELTTEELPGCEFTTAATPAAAWHLATSCLTEQDLLCVTGSLFIAAELRPAAVKFAIRQDLQAAASPAVSGSTATRPPATSVSPSM